MTALLRTPQNFQSPYTAASLPAHYAGSSLTVCACSLITSPVDGSKVAITSWSRNLTNVPGYPGITFKSAAGMSASIVEAQSGAAPTNLETDLFLIAAGITEAEALAGKWSRAPGIIFLMNYEAPKMGQYIVTKGFLGKFVQKGQMLSTEIMGFNQALQQVYGKVTRNECSHLYGDAGCTLNLSALGEIKTGTLTSVTDRTIFADSGRSETDDYFGNGIIHFDTGLNAGLTFHVDSWNAATKTWGLRTPTPYLPVIGDTYHATRGCRKRPSDCTARANILNGDFFPFIRTLEEMSRLPIA